MARGIKTQTHLENLAITPNSKHGDVAGDVAFAVYPVGTDPLNPGAVAANFSVTDTGIASLIGNTTIAGGLNVAGPVQGLNQLSSAISGSSVNLSVASGYFGGQVIVVTANTCDVILPAIAAGLNYTIIMKGTTSLTISALTAILVADTISSAKTHMVWSTTPIYTVVSVCCDGTNWVVTSMTTAPDSSS